MYNPVLDSKGNTVRKNGNGYYYGTTIANGLGMMLWPINGVSGIRTEWMLELGLRGYRIWELAAETWEGL